MNKQDLPDLAHYLDAALSFAEEEKEPRTYLGISQLGRCARATGYGLRPDDYPADNQIESLRFFNEGNVAEDDIVRRLIAGGCPVYNQQKEVTFPIGHPLANVAYGHIDGEVPMSPVLASPLHDDPQERAILEIKSLRMGALNKLAKAGNVSEAWPQYGIQAHTYAHCQARNWVVYIVKDRNSGDMATCWEPYDHQMVEMGVEQGLNVMRNANSDTIPRRDYNPSKDWQCRKEYCKYRTYCLEEGE